MHRFESQTLRSALRASRGYLIFLGVAILFPFVASPALTNTAVYVTIYGIAAVGLMLLMGLAGQVSLGHAAFFAVGAYTQAILTTNYDVNWLLAVLPSVALSMALALLLGWPLLRLRGHYLALATLGLGIIIGIVANESGFTGGASGLFGIAKPEIAGHRFGTAADYFWLIAPVLLVAVIVARNIVDSRMGRALQAISDSEIAAETLGVNTYRLRLLVFTISGGYAGLAGVFYAHWLGVVSPETSKFSFSIMFVLMVVLGGIGSVWGAVFGALGAVLLEEVMRQFVPQLIPGAGGEVQMLGFGIALILLLMTMPGGMAQLGARISERVRSARQAGPAALREKAQQTDELPEGASHCGEPRRFGATDGLEALGDGPRNPRGQTVMSARGVSKHFNGVVAVDNLTLDVRAGEILALIGPNGAGKTTSFNMMTGVVPPTRGSVHLGGRSVADRKPHVIARLGATRTFQNLQVFGSASVLDNVRVGRHLRTRRGLVSSALRFPAAKEERRITRDAWSLVRSVGLGEVAERPVGELAFGTQRLIEIARALAMEPEVLMLDEPMAGLSPAERVELAKLLRQIRDRGVALVLVEHDVEQVLALADRVAVLDKGKLIAYGPPDEIRSDPVVIAAYLGLDADTTPVGTISEGGTR
ncbi:ATP-binding cassette domain-containing protein [Mycolicibacterium sp.]|uniref:branched-chain amino acid ABC transporter ATP-binding protein/permease n=1 Tax=Mycolicibacterium sp. TaxID=2320850 RepID=UPI0037CB6102